MIKNSSKNRKDSPSVLETIKKYSDQIKKFYKGVDNEGKFKKALAYIYPLTLILIVTIVPAIYFFRKLNQKGWSWIEFITLNIPVTLLGYIWTYDLQTYDKDIGAWSFLPWTFSMVEVWKGTVLEDFFFFPIASLPMYLTSVLAIHYSDKLKDFKSRKFISFYLWLAMFCLSYFFLTTTERFSWTTFWLFSFPFLIMFPLVRESINVKMTIIVIFIMGLFGFIWNFICVDLGRLVGWDWLSGWYYTIQENGTYIHSDVYVDKNIFPSYWIFNSPTSMVIYMPIIGAAFCHTFILAYRKWCQE